MAKESLDQKIQRIEAIARELENNSLDLEKAINLYEEGMKLVSECSDDIEKAQNTILKLTPDNTKVEVTEEVLSE